MDMDFALFRQVADNNNDERNVRARFYDKAVKTDKITANGLPVLLSSGYKALSFILWKKSGSFFSRRGLCQMP